MGDPEGQRGSVGLERVATATAAVLVDGRRCGSATLVTSRHLLTAAHVLRRAEKTAVAFPHRDTDGAFDVRRVELGGEAVASDVAVLELDGVELDCPVGLWAFEQLPEALAVFGYPLSERAPVGVWRGSTLAGPVGRHAVQMDWDGAVGALDGQSGGPVVAAEAGSLVGILVAGSERGRFDRFVPVTVIRRLWSELPRPWVYTGHAAIEHFVSRAAGHRSPSQVQDAFSGREGALTVLSAWLTSREAAGVPLVVTGEAGAGKSAVVARAARLLEVDRRVDGLAFHARRATAADLIDAVARACGTTATSSWQMLVRDLHKARDKDRFAVVVDALDEAASTEDRSELRSFLRELAGVEWMRVAVATRRLAAGNPYRYGSHMRALGVTSDANPNLVDLDSERYFDPNDLIVLAGSLLTQRNFHTARPAWGAWRTYREDPVLCRRVAEVVAARAGRNFLVAGMAASQLSESETAADPADPRFDPSSIPLSVGDALDRQLATFERSERYRIEGLLTALAYAQGPGLTDDYWLGFAHALGVETVTSDDLAHLRDSPAADYLIETWGSGQEATTRLFHQAIVDELRGRRNEVHDEQRLFRYLAGNLGDTGWAHALGYARYHGAAHAFGAGELIDLLHDPGFLVGVHPSGLRPHLPPPEQGRPEDPAAIYDVALPHLVGDSGHDASVLALIARTQGNDQLAAGLDALDGLERPFELSGNLQPFMRALARFDGHTDVVVAVTSLDWPGRDGPVVATGSADRSVRVWDPQAPSVELARFDGHTRAITTLVALAWPDRDHPVVVSTSADGRVCAWDPLEPGVELAHFDSHLEDAVGLTVTMWPGCDHPVLVTSSTDGVIQAWDPRRPDRALARVEQPVDDSEFRRPSLEAISWPGRAHPALVSTPNEGVVLIWDPADPHAELARLESHTAGTVTDLPWPGHDHRVIAHETNGHTIRVCDPARPDVELTSLGGATKKGHTSAIYRILTMSWPGREHPVLVSASWDGTVRVWDPQATSGAELLRIDGHTGPVVDIAALSWPGRDHPVIVTASRDRTARVWDPHIPFESFAGHRHTDALRSVTTLPRWRHHRPSIVTTSWDGTARVWDGGDPSIQVAQFDEHDGPVLAIARLSLFGYEHPVVVTTSTDGTARVWDPYDLCADLGRFDSHEGAITGVATMAVPGSGHSLVVTAGADGTARIWDPRRPEAEIARFDLRTPEREPDVHVTTVAWPERSEPVVVTATWDGVVQVWDPQAPDADLATFAYDNRSGLTSLAALTQPDGGHPLIVCTFQNWKAHVWDTAVTDSESGRFIGHDGPVQGSASMPWPGRRQKMVVTTSDDGTARIWDPWHPDVELMRLPLLGQGRDVAILDDERIAISTNRGLVLLRPRPEYA